MRLTGALRPGLPSAPGLSGVVWALLISAVLVPLGVLAIGAWLAWGEAWRQAESELARTADAAAEYAARVLDGHLLLADRVDDLLADLPDPAIRDKEAELHAAMQRMAATRPSVLTLYAIDAEGRPLVSANVFPVPRDASLEDRDFFSALRGPGAPDVFVSKVHVGRFDGQLFFSVAQRRGSASESGDLPGETAFRGIVLASLRPNELALRLRQLAGERTDRLALVRTDGELLARTREFESPPQSLGADSAMRPIMEAGTDRMIVRGRSSVDGLERVAAYRRVEGWPVYALAARPRAAVVARWRGVVAAQAGFGVPAAFALVGLVFFATRRARDAAEARAALLGEAERRSAAEALAESEARLQRALAAGRVFAFEWEPATDEVLRSASCGPILGFDAKGEATRDTGRGFFDRIHPEDRDRFVAAATGVTPRDPSYAIRYRYRRPDGRLAWLEEAATARFGPDGKLAHLSGLARDVTAEVEAEAALRDSEARLQLAQEAGGVGTWDWDVLRGVVTCSDAYCRLYGLDPKGPGHQSPEEWLSQVHPDDRERVQAVRRAALPSGRYESEYRIIRADGSVRRIADRATALFDEEGRLVRFLGANVDVTETREAEERLRELQSQLLHASRLSAMGEMAAALAHELNQPLGAATNFLNAARIALTNGGPDAPERALARLGKAAEQTLRAGAILRRLRGFVTRGETDKRIDDTRRLVEDAVALALVGVRDPDLRTRLDFDPRAASVLVDGTQIQQVLFNLVRNALEATEERRPREITITTRTAGVNEVEISVADTGPGLPGERLSTLFQPFITTKPDGLGIGLSVCRAIVEAHGGRLWAEPRPGGGTVFRFTVPAAVPASEAVHG